MKVQPLRLSVVMPVYNEVATVENSIQRVWQVPLDTEIICVDDGSTDGTTAVLRRLEDEGVIDTLIVHEQNAGKGTAVRAGIGAATGDVMVIQDADLEYDPLEFPRLLSPIADGRADAVFGSRFLGGPHRVLYFWHRVGNGVLTVLSNMLTDLNLTDMETCYKMARLDLVKSLPLSASRFGIEPELTARLAQSRARIYEVPISYAGRTYAEGKKIGWKDGIAALWHILRFNLLPPKAPYYRSPVDDSLTLEGTRPTGGVGIAALGSAAAGAEASAGGDGRPAGDGGPAGRHHGLDARPGDAPAEEYAVEAAAGEAAAGDQSAEPASSDPRPRPE